MCLKSAGIGSRPYKHPSIHFPVPGCGALDPNPAGFRQKADYTPDWSLGSHTARIETDNYSLAQSHCHCVGTEPMMPALSFYFVMNYYLNE